MDRQGFGGLEPSHFSTQVPLQDRRFRAFFLQVQRIFDHPVFQDPGQSNHVLLAALKNDFEQAVQQFQESEQTDHLRGNPEDDFEVWLSESSGLYFPYPYPEFSSDFSQVSSDGSKHSK
jgi:hypothetical protein